MTINKPKKMIPVAEPWIGKGEMDAVVDCLKTNWISSIGKYIPAFEKGFASFCQSRYGIATSNGTTALHLALLTIGLCQGDEVIVPTLTFIATANAASYIGAKPVFVDSDPNNWTIDPSRIEEKITRNTKAIIPVHLYGHPADMDPILKIAQKHHLFVIEDAAEAHGALYKGRKVGSLSDMGCFSFYGNKIITTGEGGMVLTSNLDWAQKAKFLRDHGMSKTRKYWHPVIGYNFRMTNIQAAIGQAQLGRIERIIEKKRRNAFLYNSLLQNIRGIKLPPEEKWAKNVYWMYNILIEDEFGITRDELMIKLKENNIDSRRFFIPIHLMPPYRTEEQHSIAESLSRKGISLPSGVTLKKNQIERIADVIRKLSQSKNKKS